MLPRNAPGVLRRLKGSHGLNGLTRADGFYDTKTHEAHEGHEDYLLIFFVFFVPFVWLRGIVPSARAAVSL